MDGSRTINLAWARADRLIDALQAAGVTAGEAQNESDLFWQLAASSARIPDDPETRNLALVRMADREANQDVFGGLSQEVQL